MAFSSFSCSDSGHAVRGICHSDSVQSGGGCAAAELWGDTSDVSAHTRCSWLVCALPRWAVCPAKGPRHPDQGHGATARDIIPPASVFWRRASGQDEQHILPPHYLQPAARRSGPILLRGIRVDPGPRPLLVRHDAQAVRQDNGQSSAHRWVPGWTALSYRDLNHFLDHQVGFLPLVFDVMFIRWSWSSHSFPWQCFNIFTLIAYILHISYFSRVNQGWARSLTNMKPSVVAQSPPPGCSYLQWPTQYVPPHGRVGKILNRYKLIWNDFVLLKHSHRVADSAVNRCHFRLTYAMCRSLSKIKLITSLLGGQQSILLTLSSGLEFIQGQCARVSFYHWGLRRS